METIKMNNGTLKIISYQDTEKGKLKITIHETLDGLATLDKEYI